VLEETMKAFVLVGLAFLLAGAQAMERGDRRDSDGDSVPDASDRCPSTPSRAEPILQGCAVIELIARPGIFADPARTALDIAARGIVLDGVSDDYDRDSTQMRRRLQEASSRFNAAAGELGRGELCTMAETTAGVRDSLEEISRRTHELLRTGRVALQRRVRPDDRDADFEEVAFHELGYRAGLVGQAVVAIRVAHEIASRACDQVQRPTRWIGIVTRTDEAAHIMELSGRRVFVLPAGVVTPGEGARVLVEGLALEHRMAIAKSIGPAGNDPPVLSVVDDPVFLPPCVELLIAPFQPFHPPIPVSSNYVLHDPIGYIGFDDGPVLNLESPMRLAASITGACPTQSSPTGKFHTFRYSLRLLYKQKGSPNFNEFASDLTPPEDPVELPITALPFGSIESADGVLRVVAQRQKCIGSARKGRRGRCSSTFQTLRTTDYDVTVRPRGAYGELHYLGTLFDIDPTIPGDFDVAEVTTFSVHPTLTAQFTEFRAEGRSASGSNAIETIDAGNRSFAIRADDFYETDLVAPTASTGTDRPSGLQWPRIIGIRNGSPFWYSAMVPFIDRDLAKLCDPGPDSFYRLPWQSGAPEPVTQGNSTSNSHTAGSSQEFAFDFGHGLGVPIHAARGGTIEWLTEMQTTTFDPSQPVSSSNQEFDDGDLLNWGNAVRIGHQDGTTGWYFHIDTFGVHVNVGQVVIRCEPIAEAGNTGRSSMPHLHFQVQNGNVNWGQSIPIRFDTANPLLTRSRPRSAAS
jgi:murein DD-endopeptidase MepM/ murein hydrolase activator NlpD